MSIGIFPPRRANHRKRRYLGRQWRDAPLSAAARGL